MEWINPRERLPENGQLIWILLVENRQGERCGLPAGSIELAEAERDRFGIIAAQTISHKGYAQYHRHFYEWWHFPQDNKEDNEIIYQTFSNGSLITAWLPYEQNELPKWNNIGLKESKEIISANESYKLACQLEKSQGNNTNFIQLSDFKPETNGIYVVVNEDGIWLSKYEIDICELWIAPNGKPVVAWYPVPSYY